MNQTKLSTIIARMDRWKQISEIEEQYKVRDLDAAIRKTKRNLKLPFVIKKSTLRVFDEVLEYPTASDHDTLAYLDTQKNQFYPQTARFKYTNLREFFENPDNRNDLAEIWKNNVKTLGVRYNSGDMSSALVDNGEDYTKFTASGDASGLQNETVVYKDGNGSVRFTNTVNTGIATIECNFTPIADNNYKRKYFFLSVYLDKTPTSIDLIYGNDSSNNLSVNLTTQFSGQAFVEGDWNLIAIDLNTATVNGTIDPNTFKYYAFNLNGALSGTFYIDSSYLRSWQLMDYWYYSKNYVKTVAGVEREYFINDDETPSYQTDMLLIGDDEWTDYIMYEACQMGVGEKENANLYNQFSELKNDAFDALSDKYPSLEMIMIGTKYRFTSDFLEESSVDDDWA